MVKKENRFLIYEHWRPDTGVCFYVGKASREDRADLLVRSYNKHHYGIVNKLKLKGLFVIIMVAAKNLLESEAFELEKNLIREYGRSDLGLGTLCNHTDGGDGSSGAVRDDDFKRKVSNRMKGNKHRLNLPSWNKGKKGWISAEEIEKKRERMRNGRWMLGKKHSEESKRKMSESQRGRITSLETKIKISEALKGRLGKPLSAETRMKVSKSIREKFSTGEMRKKLSESAKRRFANESKDVKFQRAKRTSQMMKGNQYRVGKKLSEEHKEKIRLGRERFLVDEVRQREQSEKISLAKKGAKLHILPDGRRTYVRPAIAA